MKLTDNIEENGIHVRISHYDNIGWCIDLIGCDKMSEADEALQQILENQEIVERLRAEANNNIFDNPNDYIIRPYLQSILKGDKKDG